ncbi:MAG: NAD-binding protein, partial [Candidatus Limnocylindria bacterium]
MYVVVVGGGNVGYYLTRELLQAGHEVVMIEKNASRARQIADELGSIVVPNDGCEGRYQEQAGMGRADVVAAVTGDDEDNLVACQVAKMHFNVPRSIARVHIPINVQLFRRRAFVVTVSP